MNSNVVNRRMWLWQIMWVPECWCQSMCNLLSLLLWPNTHPRMYSGLWKHWIEHVTMDLSYTGFTFQTRMSKSVEALRLVLRLGVPVAFSAVDYQLTLVLSPLFIMYWKSWQSYSNFLNWKHRFLHWLPVTCLHVVACYWPGWSNKFQLFNVQ